MKSMLRAASRRSGLQLARRQLSSHSAIVTTQHGDGVVELRMSQGKANSLNTAMLNEITAFLGSANTDPDVSVVVLTGANRFFCAGADVKDGVKVPSDLSPVGVCMHAFIDFDKPIIGAVNGPAVGGGVTMLAHCDYNFATSSATFWCPFAELGIAPEFCSSVLLPHIMGHNWSHRVLVEGAKLSADDALASGLIGEVLESPEATLDKAVAHAKLLASRPGAGKMLGVVKGMLRRHTFSKELLHRVCTEELAVLDERLLSGETKLPLAK